MYLNHWKLVRRPFDERLDPQWFFPSASHQHALLKLRFAVEQQAGVACLAGGLGFGKSMVAAALSDALSEDGHPVARLPLSPTTACGVVAEIAEQIHQLAPDKAPDVAPDVDARDGHLATLRRLLIGRREDRRPPVILLDGAEYLDDVAIHSLVATLSELAAQRPSQLTVVLIGPTELLVRAQRVARTDERLFPQVLLTAMSPSDTAAYVSHRIQMAGGLPSLFTPAAVELIHDLAGGVPRRINRLCDLSLLVGYAADVREVGTSHVWTAQAELRVLRPTRTSAAPATRRWRPLEFRDQGSGIGDQGSGTKSQRSPLIHHT